MLRRLLVPAAVALAVAAPAAARAAPRLGTPAYVTTLPGESNFITSDSTFGHPDAYAIFSSELGRNVESVVHVDDRGRPHRFVVGTSRTWQPEGVRLFPIEGGGGMALWDDGRAHEVRARTWGPGGTEGPVQVALAGVDVVFAAEGDGPEWRARAGGDGTVVVASTGAPPRDTGSVLAAVREPGGAFGPPQELTPPGATGLFQRPLAISPVGADGSVAVSWGDGSAGVARRTGRGPFGPPEAQPFGEQPRLSPTNRTAPAADGTPVTVSAAVAALCPCPPPHLLTWGDGTRVLAVQVFSRPTTFPVGELGGWYVARPGAGGAFDAPVKATDDGSVVAMRATRPGEVAFAKLDTEADFGLFRREARLERIPFGPDVPRSRQAPRTGFGAYGVVSRGHLFLPVFCDRVCSVDVRDARFRRLPLAEPGVGAASRRLEPFTVVYASVPLPQHSPVRLRVGAVDNAGHRRAIGGTYVRGGRGQWCLSTRRSRPGCT